MADPCKAVQSFCSCRQKILDTALIYAQKLQLKASSNTSDPLVFEQILNINFFRLSFLNVYISLAIQILKTSEKSLSYNLVI